jgi:hypothetical protein
MSMTKISKTVGITFLIGCLVVALCATVPVARAQQKTPGILSVADGEGNPVPPEMRVEGKKMVFPDDMQVLMNKGKYTCNDTVVLTVADLAAREPVSVTLISKDSGGTIIDTKVLSPTATVWEGVFTASIATGSGIAVVNGGSLTAVYGELAPAIAAVSCAVALDKAQYGCDQTVQVTVSDGAATSPVSVTIQSKDAGATVIDTQVVSCTGSGGVFTGTILLGTGIAVTDGGSITASYGACTPATAGVGCGLILTDAGFALQGGCDNNAAPANIVSGPLYNGGSNEYYTKYMDGGEYTAYTFKFTNDTGKPLTDVWVALSFSGAGASDMTALNNPVHVGSVPVGGTAGAVFQLYTDPSTPGMTSVNLDFDVTAPLDGYSLAARLTQVTLLQVNDIVARQEHCTTFDTNPMPSIWYESRVTGGTTNPWRWTGAAANPSTVGSENRTDGICSSSAANKGMMVGNSATTAANNFNNNADSFLLTNFQPVLTGNAPNGQPYHYMWKWHSFYHASEVLGNQSGVWGAFYNDQWNSAVNPTGDDAGAFPIALCCYYQSIFDYVGIWNWETANTGIPDSPGSAPSAPNQLIITFGGTGGLATTSTWFAYGHEHWDVYFSNGQTSHGTHRDVALDNDNLVYDEYYADAQVGASCGAGGQVGQVAFDRLSYDDCPSSTAVLSVVDADAVGPLQVTVTSGAGDSEVVTLTGSAPYFSGNLTLATNAGTGANDGVLFVLPIDSISATYTDSSPAGSTTANASSGCPTGDVIYVSNTLVADNGDNDGFADNNETVTMDITIQNNMATDLTNAKVQIFPASSNIDCVFDAEALYGTVAAGATATNPPTDRFSFHVSPTVACTDWQAPPQAKFLVVITGDDFYGSPSLQTFNLSIDLDPAAGGTWTLSQNFDADPGWTTGTLPDDDGVCNLPWVNEFHWCAACGNGGGGYGAWAGDSPFGTPGQNYNLMDSSALYSPIVVANGAVTLQFDVAYRTENGYDGAQVQVKVGAAPWAYVPFTTPPQINLTATAAYCSPLKASSPGWSGTALASPWWTATNTASVTAALGDTIQFRWRLGADTSVLPSSFGGLGVDNVVIGNLSQTQVCESDRNTCLPGCTGGPWALHCPDPVTSECQGNLAANVTVPPATIAGGCGGDVTVTNSYTSGGADASGTYPLGTTTVTYSASDIYGDHQSCQTTITVADTIPPVVTVGSSPSMLWPPNHRMVSITNTLVATDICDPNPTNISICGATSNEPDDANGVGDGATINDIQCIDGQLWLRAERDGTRSGRVYTMNFQFTDSSGNVSGASSAVTVPHSMANSATEPLMLSLNDRHNTRLEWLPVENAQHYDVVRGDLANVQAQGSNIELGQVVCIDSQTTDNTTMGFEDTAVPAPGHVFFYVAQFFDGAKESSYGTESAGKARVIKPNMGDCH